MDRLTRSDLIAWFHQQCKAPSLFRIGAEWEKEALTLDGKRVSYFSSPFGISDLLKGLSQRFGWIPEREGENIIALSRDGTTVTLEPGCQVEISVKPLTDIAEVEREFISHLRELQEIAGPDVYWSSLAFTPYQDVDDIPWVPKGRYAQMGPYLKTRGRLSHHMMKGTTSIQASFDYSSEADCARKLVASLALSPLATALFANSPLVKGEPVSAKSFRALTWRETDPARCGLLEDVVDQDFTFERWVDYLLDVPLMFTKKGGVWGPGGGRNFRQWMEEGVEGHFAGWKEWNLQMTSVFPEVRLKNYVEIRSCDGGPLEMLLAMPALWRGILYDEGALQQALDLAGELPGPRESLGLVAATQGLQGTWGGRTLTAWAQELVAIADRGLSAQKRDGIRGPDERKYLEPLKNRLDRGGIAPSSDSLRAWEETEGIPSLFVPRMAYPRP